MSDGLFKWILEWFVQGPVLTNVLVNNLAMERKLQGWIWESVLVKT